MPAGEGGRDRSRFADYSDTSMVTPGRRKVKNYILNGDNVLLVQLLSDILKTAIVLNSRKPKARLEWAKNHSSKRCTGRQSLEI